MKTKIILFTVFVWLFATTGYCTTYYMQESGTNADPDCSESSACCASAMDMPDFNAATFAGDDIIYVCDDDGVYRSQMIPPDSGTSGHQITVKNAPGDSPIINGADDVTGVSGNWAEQGDGIWRKDIGSVEPFAVFFDSTHVGVEDATPDTEYEWTYSDPNLDVYTSAGDDNPVDHYTLIEATQRNVGIRLDDDIDFITFDGLEIANHGATDVATGVPGAITDAYAETTFATDITIQNCTFTNNMASITIREDTAGTGSDRWLIDNNTFTAWDGAVGISVAGPSNITISNNTLSDFKKGMFLTGVGSNITIDTNTVTRYAHFGIDFEPTGGDHFTVTDNIVREPTGNYDAYELAFLCSPTDVTITGNSFYQDGSAYGDSGIIVDMYDGGQATITDNYVEGAKCMGMYILGGDGHTISNNHFKDCGDGCHSGTAGQHGLSVASASWQAADRTAENHVVSYNIFDNCYSSIYLVETIVAASSGHKVYNNTIANAIGQYGFRAFGEITGVEFKNNIITGTSDKLIWIDQFFIGSITLNNNCYDGTGTYRWDLTSHATLALYQTASSKDANSKEADPLFVDAAGGNFGLKFGSPCINAGTNLGPPYNDALDPRDLTFPYDTFDQDFYAPWEIGAKAYIRRYDIGFVKDVLQNLTFYKTDEIVKE